MAMDPSLGPTICIVTGILTTGAVLILRPVSKRLGALLEAMTQDRLASRKSAPEMARVRELLSGIDTRLSNLEERQDFAEALISTGEPPRPLPARPPAN